ncbi:MAG: hypothetical protein ACRDQ7_23475 [Haloechinothrix sp.]
MVVQVSPAPEKVAACSPMTALLLATRATSRVLAGTLNDVVVLVPSPAEISGGPRLSVPDPPVPPAAGWVCSVTRPRASQAVQCRDHRPDFDTPGDNLLAGDIRVGAEM